MSIYDIDYNNVVTNLSPSQKRLPVWLAWLQALAAPLQWKHDNFECNYQQGSSYNYWQSAGTYNEGDRVLDIDMGVYEAGPGIAHAPNVQPASQQAAWSKNINYPQYAVLQYGDTQYVSLPLNNAGNIPGTDLTNWAPVWIPVTKNYIGANEHIAYWGQKIMLELALNRYFNWVLTVQGIVSAFDTLDIYDSGDYVFYNSDVYVSTTIAGPGAFNQAQWSLVPRTTFRQPAFADTVTTWLNSITYSLGSVVGNGGIRWVSLTNGNHNNIPGNDLVNWEWYSYNRSDIYIDDNFFQNGFFVFGGDNVLNGLVFGGNNAANGVVFGGDPSATTGATIYVPDSLSSTIPNWFTNFKNTYHNGDATQAQNAILSIAYKFAIAGVTFNITTY